MKIRTDFVTNSSSSSFISYQINRALLEQVLRRISPGLKLGKRDWIRTRNYIETMILQYEDMSSAPSLPQMIIAMLAKGNDYDDTVEYENLDRFDVNEFLKPDDSADCTAYCPQTVYDGSDASVAKLIYELYNKTDLFSRIAEKTDFWQGGGELFLEAQFCDYESSGEHIVTTNGKITEYYAHPYLGGFGYMGDEAAFIAFEGGFVTLNDREMEYENQSVIWDDESVAQTLAELSDENVTCGLSHIEHLECKKLKHLLVPERCAVILSEALTDCPALEKVYIPSNETELEDGAVSDTVTIAAPVGSPAQQYAKMHGNPFEEYDEDAIEFESTSSGSRHYTGEHTVHSENEDLNFGFVISEDCGYIDEDDDFPLLFFASRTVKIKENSLSNVAVMHGFSGSTAEQYAKQHGITFHLIDSTDFDPDALPQNVHIEDGMLYANGRVCLRLNGLTDKQLAEVPAGEKLELVPEPDAMTNLRLVFRSAETGDYRGLLTYRAGYTASYLMQKGYLKFEDIITEENGYVMVSVLWQQPMTEQTKQQLRFYQKILSCYPKSRRYIVEEPCFSRFFTPAQQVAAMDSESGAQTALPNMIAELFEPGNRLSFYSMRCIHSIGAALSTLHYNQHDRYGIVGSPFELSVDAGRKITCYLNGKQTALTPDEEAYARVYIDQYRKIYNLPLLFTDGGEQNGTV